MNLVGLSIGLVSALLVALVLYHEFTYDTFHPKGDRTFRLAGVRNYGFFPTLPIHYSNLIKQGEYPEVEDFVRMRRWPAKFIKAANKKIFEEKVLMTDPGSSFFRVFGFELISGTPETALARPYSVVLSRKLAENLFSTTDIIGERLEYDTMSLTVTGVMENLPSNSHLTAQALITNERAMAMGSGGFSYCVFREGANQSDFVGKLVSSHPGQEGNDKLDGIELQRLEDIHFGSAATYELKPPGNLLYLILFSSIGFIVLLITTSNYVNLSVAMYAERSKEIAVRKAMGVKSNDLMAQVLVETLLLSLLSLPLSVALTDLALPWINMLLQVDIGSHVFARPLIAFSLISITLFVGLLAGLYPALAIPRFSTIALFKNTIASVNGLRMRQRMVMVQFSLLVLLGGSAWIIQQQLRYIQTMDLGFNKDEVVKLSNAWNLSLSEYSRMKGQLLEHPSITHVSQGIAPGDEEYGFPFRMAGSEEIFQDLIVTTSDFDYVHALGLDMSSAPVDWKNPPNLLVLVNETLAKRLDGNQVAGQKIILNPGASYERERTIDGVFSDIHFRSLHQAVGPHMLVLRRDVTGINQNVLIRAEGGMNPELLAFVQGTINEIAPELPMQVESLSDDIQRSYTNEKNLADLTICLVVVACVTSLIGLVGFISYLTELRTKEVGIRIILGASNYEIILLMGRSLLTVVAMASLTGVLGAYFLSGYWLQSFAYRIDTTWLPFIVTGLGGILLALGINVWKGYHACQKNPVDSLRYE